MPKFRVNSLLVTITDKMMKAISLRKVTFHSTEITLILSAINCRNPRQVSRGTYRGCDISVRPDV